MTLIISDDAATDIGMIVRYTKREHGAVQARFYGDGLVRMIRMIVDRPMIGRPVSDLPVRFRKVTYRSHHIYFTIEGADVVIVRVLHQARDALRHIVF